ncbi:MAG: DUF4124 domain-containing protein [Alteromonadaceae bacterium TMED7]|nr:hypothetical protein [Alteromonadaceae bacterium]RPH22621.1 MAG: DUF4124 domain-containing protein [Alteromonadaceae bacterium TMED7]|tara:strand:+ start:3787 stop:4299 length:513 start_codon:yes stop_codon:yes gene_type:complete
MLRLFLMLSLCSTPGYAQEIYKVVNKDGSVTYTDKPVVNAEPVELGPDNRVSMPVPPPQPVQPATKSATADKPKPVIEVVNPKPEATVRNNAGNMTIAANVRNADKQGKFKLYINDSLVKEQSSAVFQLQGINRGAHTFYITHTDNTGKTLASTSPQTFYLHQASRLINN